MTHHKRRIKLIKPRLQVRLTMTFVGLAAMALVMQFLLLLAMLSELSAHLPQDGIAMLDRVDTVLLKVLATSALLFLPLIFAVGILTTFRIAGPLYRFERYLEQIARGEAPGPCKLRDGDELQDLCELLNRAVTSMERRIEQQRTEQADETPGEGPAPDAERDVA